MKAETLSRPPLDSRFAGIKKVVVFRALNLGDMLCAVPALRALRRGLPRAEITLLGLLWARQFAARFHQYLNHFVAFPGYPGLPEQPCRENEIEQFFESMRQQKYDLAIQLHGSGAVSNRVISSLGARCTAGFYDAGREAPDPDWYAPYPEALPEIDRNLSLMRHLGLPAGDRQLEFLFLSRDAEELERFPGLNGLVTKAYACIHPGASAREKCWPVNRFATVGKYLREQGLILVVTGNRRESDLAGRISSTVGAGCVDAASPDLSLGSLALLIKRARLLVSNDTGVSHLASALQVPSVIVFTRADPVRWGPLDRNRHRVVGAPGTVPAVNEVLDEVRTVLS